MFFVIIKLRNNRFRIFNYQRTKTMRYSSLLALCAFMLCLNTPEVRGEILAVHTYDVMTHTALLPKPVASDNTFSLAATWWLPDWQGSQGSRGSDDAGGGDIVKDDSDCMKHYNLYAKCPSPKLSTGVVHPVAGMTCQKSCYCPSSYQYTSSNCSGNYTVSGGSCDGKYNACVCKSEFKYNSSNCSGEYQVSGTSCGGKYNSCTIRPECTITSKDCTYGCAGYNSCSRCTSCKSNPDCNVTDKSCTYGCASYNSCSKCTSCKSNPDCNVTDKSCTYGCASYNSCSKCTSCKSNPDCDVADKSCDYGCAATNSCGKCTSCKSCSNTCDSGYSLTACSSSQVQTSSKANQCGNPCYQCRAKTCAEQGKKDCNGSCISTSECCGGCPSGYSCKNGSCEKDHTHSYSCPNGYSTSCSKGYFLTTSKTCSCGAKSGTCYKCKECNSASDCPSYNPVCSDGICGCRSGYYLNGGGYCCPNDVPNGTVSDACYY